MTFQTRFRVLFLFSLISACSSRGATSAAAGATVISWYVGATGVQTTVKAGTTVQWKSTDGMEHTVTSTSTPPAFGELDVAAGGYSPPMVFETPGTFPYFCAIHGARVQNGTLTVTAGY